MARTPIRLVAGAIVLVAALVLTGCAYDGKVTGVIGETLTFPVGEHQLSLTVERLEAVSSADAEQWQIGKFGFDVYFVRYSGDRSLSWGDWAVVTESGEVVLSQPPKTSFPAVGVPEDQHCDVEWKLADECAIVLVPAGEVVTSVRYLGVESGRSCIRCLGRGGTIIGGEWVAWTIDV